jgi:hypothetical protein
VIPYGPIEPLHDHHLLDGFESGKASLDDWLVRHARPNQTAGSSRTYVIADSDTVVGYHALSSFTIWRADATGRVRRQGPPQIPAVLLGRLALSRRAQGHGLGAILLCHGLELTVAASETVGIRVLVVSALDETCGHLLSPLRTRAFPH